MKAIGKLPHFLESVSWSKPGLLEVRISGFFPIDAKGKISSETTPEVKSHFTGANLVLEGREMSWQDGVAKVSWIYRAGNEIDRSPEDRSPDGMHAEQWTMSATVQQIPLETHPKLKQIMAVGGGVFSEGRVEFPRYINGEKNPWYGITDFLFPSISVSVKLPPRSRGFNFSELNYLGYSDVVGGKHPSMAGFSFSGISAYSGHRPWLLTDMNFLKRGNSLFEVRSWRWGGMVGWADPVYSKNWSGGNSENTSSNQTNRTGA